MNAISTSGASGLNIVRSLPLCLLLLLAAPNPAAALDPNRLITQYGHTGWRTKDGDLTTPAGITQTTDGYIWLGTTEGLMRFDGVKFTLWTPPEGQSLPNRGFGALLGAGDGSLWMGTPGGLTQLKDGRLFSYTPEESGGVTAIIEDETGAVWFTRYRITDGKGPLCRIKDGDLRCFGKEDGVPASYGLGLAKDGAGNIWFGSTVLCRWKDGASAVYFEEELKPTPGDGVVDVAVGPSGQVWAALDATGPELGVRHYSDGKWAAYVVPGFDGPNVRSHTLYTDRHGSLWVGTSSEGLYHIHNGLADHYGMENGLSGKSVSHVYEDREGNIWVVTEGGVDMFRDTPVVSFTTSEGLSSAGINSILAQRDGSVWVSDGTAVEIIRPDSRTAITPLKGVPREDVTGMFEDNSGGIWLGVGTRLLSYEGGRFFEVKRLSGAAAGNVGTTPALTGDFNGNVWALVFKDDKRSLLRLKGRIVQEEIPLEDSIRRAKFLAADREGGVWIGSSRDKLIRYRDGRMEAISLGGENAVTIYSLLVDSDNALWVSTNKGLYRLKDGSLSLLDAHNGLPCESVFATLIDDSGDFWLYARCGLLRIPASDMAAWRNRPESRVSVKTFDAYDGALPAAGDVKDPRAVKSPDGRLWFITNRAAQMIDPGRVYSNPVPPSVHIEGIISDRQSYPARGQVALPPLRNELEIDYTALSFTVPRKVRFRYRLEGHDAGWQDVGTRRQAFYNNLGPGSYRFRVIACNGDGVWNEVGAALDFRIEPTWYQTASFRVLCLLLFVLTAWGLHRLRIRQVSRAINARFDDRLAERTRLARELHDTFLQTLQGSKLVADDALERPDDTARLRRSMEQLSLWLAQAVDEGRAALNSLRTSTTEKNDLAAALRRATDACVAQCSMATTFAVVGDSRDMHPIVRDEVYRIGYEAIRNACAHSGASRLAVELRYEHDLVVRVKDDGKGIHPAVVADGKQGHFGLQGMRERAGRIGAKLTLDSSATSGTEVTLVVPGGIVFRNEGVTRFAPLRAVLRRISRTSDPD